MADSEALNSYFAVVSPKWRIGLAYSWRIFRSSLWLNHSGISKRLARSPCGQQNGIRLLSDEAVWQPAASLAARGDKSDRLSATITVGRASKRSMT